MATSPWFHDKRKDYFLDDLDYTSTRLHEAISNEGYLKSEVNDALQTLENATSLHTRLNQASQKLDQVSNQTGGQSLSVFQDDKGELWLSRQDKDHYKLEYKSKETRQYLSYMDGSRDLTLHQIQIPIERRGDAWKVSKSNGSSLDEALSPQMIRVLPRPDLHVLNHRFVTLRTSESLSPEGEKSCPGDLIDVTLDHPLEAIRDALYLFKKFNGTALKALIE